MHENYAIEEKKSFEKIELILDSVNDDPSLHEQILHECELPDVAVYHGF